MPVSTDQTENKNGLASDTASPLKVKRSCQHIKKRRGNLINVINVNLLLMQPGDIVAATIEAYRIFKLRNILSNRRNICYNI